MLDPRGKRIPGSKSIAGAYIAIPPPARPKIAVLIPLLPADIAIRGKRPRSRRTIAGIQVGEITCFERRIGRGALISQIGIPVDVPFRVWLKFQLRPKVQRIMLRLDDLPAV